jgi:hypothetical protein
MDLDATKVCYLITIVVSIGFIIYGFMELLKDRQHNEPTEVSVISRQIRGFAFLMLAQVILVLGAMICYGSSEGLLDFGKKLKGLYRGY